MKATKIISVLSLVLIFSATSLFAKTISDPSSANQQKIITYLVQIKSTPNFPGASGHYLVVITDESGRKVVPSQPFHPGVWSYSFREAGNFRGTRVAALVPYPANSTGWIIPPSVMKANFIGGGTYKFFLTPEETEPTGTNQL